MVTATASNPMPSLPAGPQPALPTPPPSRTPLRILIRSLTQDLKTLLHQEIELAKTEASEKISCLTRQAVTVAIGAFVAYAGFIVLLIGLGWLVGWAFQKAGLQPFVAGFIGLGIIGIVVAGIGGLLTLKAIKTLSASSLVPERTIYTVQRLKGTEPNTSAQPAPTGPRPSSQEMQSQVEQTENHMGETLDELGRRLSPSEINARVKQRIRQKPYRSGLVAMGVGILSGLFLTRSSRRA